MPYHKKNIPVALKKEVWIHTNGENFKAKCYVKWCTTTITPFTFECGHNIPESKGGSTIINNLFPICSSCNKSMGNRYSITEFSENFKKKNTSIGCFSCLHSK
jgi:5-methylcytosine-specific restriction endonuclease McrA